MSIREMIAVGLEADSDQIATRLINQKHCRKDILFHEGSFALTQYQQVRIRKTQRKRLKNQTKL